MLIGRPEPVFQNLKPGKRLLRMVDPNAMGIRHGIRSRLPSGSIFAGAVAGKTGGSYDWNVSNSCIDLGRGISADVPRMKRKDEQNIRRWIRQVRHSDGTPATRDDATITVEEMGAGRLTVVDLTGRAIGVTIGVTF